MLKHIGFTRVTYPDRDYFVLHEVNASHVSSVLHELSVFVQTAARLETARLEAARAAQDPTERFESHADEMDAMQQLPDESSACDAADAARYGGSMARERRGAGSDAGPSAGGSVAASAERQLAARRAVHRVAASQQQQRAVAVALQRRWKLGAFVALILVAVVVWKQRRIQVSW